MLPTSTPTTLHRQIRNPLHVIVKRGEPTVVYDTGTNRLLNLDSLTAKVLPFWGTSTCDEIYNQLGKKYDLAEIRSRLDFLLRVENEKGWLLRARPKEFIPAWDSRSIHKSLTSELDCLVLSVTTACNFRCSYCLYSGEYQGYRSHGSTMMSLETAEAALRFFQSHSVDASEIHLNFYGGEPLLNLPVIRWGIETFPSIANGRKFYFHITTNGYLLNDEKIIRMLANADVCLTVSIDGPKNYHDKRRQTIGGISTFTRILNNLALIKKLEPEYYRRNVMFNSVLDSTNDLPLIRNFFINHPLFSKQEIICSTVKNDSPVTNLGRSSEKTGIEILENEFINQVSAGVEKFDSIFNRIFIRDLRLIHNRTPYPGVLAQEPLSGVCLPGRKELFIDPNGSFHLCENVCDDLIIGHIQLGFDFQEIARIINDYANLCSKLCIECWAYRLCRLCYIHAFTGKKIDENKQVTYCEYEKSHLLKILQRYYRIQKSNTGNINFLSV